MAVPDFIREALERAPLVDESEIDPEELAEVRQAAEDIRAGRVDTVPHEEVQQMIASMRPLAG